MASPGTEPAAPSAPEPVARAFPRPVRAAAILVVAACAAFASALDGEFLFDDSAFVEENAAVKGPFSPLAIFGSPYYEGEGYRPLVVCTFALDYTLHRLNPVGWHATNLLLHALNVLVVFALLRRLLRDDRAAFLGALLFAVHPVHVEPVAAIAQRTTLLAFLCYGLGWLAWLRGGSLGLAGALAAYLVGLLAKEEVVTLPGALLLGDWFLGRIHDRRDLARTVGRCALFVVPLAFYLLLRANALGDLEPAKRAYFADRSWPIVALTMARFAVRHYLPGMLAGANLSYDYNRPSLADAEPGDPLAWAEAALLLLGLGAAAVALVRRRSAVGFGVVFAALALLPASNLVFRIWAIGAQRYLYLPSLGFCLAVAVLCEAARRRRPAALAIPLVLVAGFFALSVSGAGQWRDGFRLFGAMLEHTPDNPLALNNLANHYERKGDRERAIELYERSARLDPEDPMAAINLALVRSGQGRHEEALERLRRVPDRGVRYRERVWSATAIPLRLLGRLAEARECLERARAIVPESARTWHQFGEVALAEGKREEAEACYRRCLERNPDHAGAAQRLAALLRERGEPARSRDVLVDVLAGNPGFATGWNDLGLSLDSLADPVAAEAAYRRALAVDPAWCVPHQNLGILLLKSKRLDEAGKHFARALELAPTLHEAKVSLGIVRLEQGRTEEAVALWREFLQAAGDEPRYAGAVQFVRSRLAALEGKK